MKFGRQKNGAMVDTGKILGILGRKTEKQTGKRNSRTPNGTDMKDKETVRTVIVL